MVEEGKGFATGGQRHRLTGWMEPHTVPVAHGVNKAAIALHTGTVIGQFDLLACIGLGIITIEFTTGMIDNALAIGGGVAHIEIFMIGMPPQIGAGDATAIQIANTFMIADKEDALLLDAIRPRNR